MRLVPANPRKLSQLLVKEFCFLNPLPRYRVTILWYIYDPFGLYLEVGSQLSIGQQFSEDWASHSHGIQDVLWFYSQKSLRFGGSALKPNIMLTTLDYYTMCGYRYD